MGIIPDFLKTEKFLTWKNEFSRQDLKVFTFTVLYCINTKSKWTQLLSKWAPSVTHASSRTTQNAIVYLIV